MKLFDNCISKMEGLLEGLPVCAFDMEHCPKWPDEGKNQMIFQSDMAYELGGSNLEAISGILLTDNEAVVPCDEILLYGQDLSELKEDISYARIALVRVKNTQDMDSDALYQMIRRIDYTRYHVSPKGYMMRISAMNKREAVRIHKEALKEGLSIKGVGRLFCEAYHKHPEVEAVKLMFITLPDFPYEETKKCLQKADDITKTLDHLAKKVQMDCQTCKLKDVCEEVEALYKKE